MKRLAAGKGRISSNGFTLVEFLIALVILGMMMTLVFNGLTLGLKSWDIITERAHISRELHLAQIFIKRQLELAQPLRLSAKGGDKRIGFEGNMHTIKFVTPIPAHIGRGGMYWFTLQVSDEPQSSNLAVLHRNIRRLNLSYELFQNEKWDRFGEEEADKLVLIDDLEEAEFAYLGAAGNPAQLESEQWQQQWSYPDRLPHLIRLRFKLSGTGSRYWRELLVAPKLAMIIPPREVGTGGKRSFR